MKFIDIKKCNLIRGEIKINKKGDRVGRVVFYPFNTKKNYEIKFDIKPNIDSYDQLLIEVKKLMKKLDNFNHIFPKITKDHRIIGVVATKTHFDFIVYKKPLTN